jgi:hypothetical protein
LIKVIDAVAVQYVSRDDAAERDDDPSDDEHGGRHLDEESEQIAWA